ncbi:hypothetical protein CSB96_0027 [Pseudomonas aeruginosa]|nr:hypothetical protein CSB96_0027 [Pseudomonas aeruginosa]
MQRRLAIQLGQGRYSRSMAGDLLLEYGEDWKRWNGLDTASLEHPAD